LPEPHTGTYASNNTNPYADGDRYSFAGADCDGYSDSHSYSFAGTDTVYDPL
jgi:hypothetical protein